MRTLKRMMVALLALLPLATGMAFAEPDQGYSRIFIFGASFMDPGNRFAVTGQTAHPPFEAISYDAYGVGGHHFSNGPTWVEVLAQDMGLTDWAKPAYRDPSYGNYAFAYAFAADPLPGDPDPLEPSLYDQVQDWIDNDYCTYTAMDDTLFILDTSWADPLGLLMGIPGDPEQIVGGMLNSLLVNIGTLYGCGARHLLVANMPPLDSSPMIVDPIDIIVARKMSEDYNAAVQDILSVYSGAMDIKTVNVFEFFTDVLDEPEDFGFTNVTETCVTPGVTKGAFCNKRNTYLFWDALHATRTANALLAERALEVLTAAD